MCLPAGGYRMRGTAVDENMRRNGGTDESQESDRPEGLTKNVGSRQMPETTPAFLFRQILSSTSATSSCGLV